MDNLQDIGDALPQESIHEKLPYELREKIAKELFQLGLAELRPYRERKAETEAERQEHREIYRTANQMHTQLQTTTSLGIVNEAQQNLLQAQRTAVDADRDYREMLRLISLKISNRSRLLRTKDEAPF